MLSQQGLQTQSEEPTTQPRRRRWNWKRIILGICAGISLTVGIVVLLAARTPSWYRPPVIAREDQQKVRKNLSDAEQAFTESLLEGGGTFIYHVYQDDVNRWLTMRREIYPAIEELVPPVLADPFVMFSDGMITLSGIYKNGASDVLVSLDLGVRFDKDCIVLDARRARCGSLPVPISLGRIDLARSMKSDADQLWPGSPAVWGDLLNGMRIGAKAWWKNGGVDYEVQNINVAPGVLSLNVRPLGRHVHERRKAHSSRP